MSHQDQGRLAASESHAQALKKAIGWLINDADFRSVTFRDDCTWTASSLCVAALLWALGDEQNLTDRFVTAGTGREERWVLAGGLVDPPGLVVGRRITGRSQSPFSGGAPLSSVCDRGIMIWPRCSAGPNARSFKSEVLGEV